MSTPKAKAVKLVQDIAELPPLDVLKARMTELGTIDGKRDGAQIDALTDFGNAIALGGNVFKFDATATDEVLKAQISGHAKDIAAIYIAAKNTASNDPLTEGSAKTYTYRFASAGMVGARNSELLPHIDAIATAYVNSPANDSKPAKKRIDVFYSICNWIKDENASNAATKKRAAKVGRRVTLEELQAEGFAAMVVDAGKKATPAVATPAVATPAVATPATPAVETPTATPATPAVDYLVMLRECADKLKARTDIDPILARAITLILNA